MTERWEYCTIEFTRHQLATRWQWCWNRGSDLFTFTKALTLFGVQGWEVAAPLKSSSTPNATPTELAGNCASTPTNRRTPQSFAQSSNVEPTSPNP